MTTTPTTTSGAADLRATFSEMLVDLPNTEPFTLFKAGFDAALAAGQATAAQAVVQDDLITIRKPTTSAEMLWLLKLAHLVISDVDKALEETFAPAQPAAPQGVAYAALPEPYCNAHDDADACYPDMFSEQQMRAFADATHTLRASHWQAPADAKALAEADRRAGEAERLLATCKEEVMRFEQVRSRMKYQWGADQRVSFDVVWDEALALKKAAQAAPQAAENVPAPPPECETEAEKRAFAFGWFKALEAERMKADNKKKDPL